MNSRRGSSGSLEDRCDASRYRQIKAIDRIDSHEIESKNVDTGYCLVPCPDWVINFERSQTAWRTSIAAKKGATSNIGLPLGIGLTEYATNP